MNIYTDLIALDIGTSSVKVVSIKPGRGKQGYKLQRVEIEEFPEGLVTGGFTDPAITDIQLFKKILKKLLKRTFSPNLGVIVGLPDRWVKIHILHDMELSEIEQKNPEYMIWRLEKSLPLPDDMSVLIDYQMVDRSDQETGETFRVISGAVKKDIIEVLSAITADLHIEVMAFDTSTLGVFNLFESVYPDRCVDRVVINCHIGHEATIVRAFDKGTLLYERVIEVAGDEFTRIISELDDVNSETACKTKEAELFFSTERKDIVQLIEKRERVEKIFGNWFRELNVTFRFFQEKFNVATLPPVFLTGGGAMFKGLPEFLSEYFGAEFIIFNPLEEMPISGKPNKDKNRLGPVVAPCVGLLSK